MALCCRDQFAQSGWNNIVFLVNFPWTFPGLHRWSLALRIVICSPWFFTFGSSMFPFQKESLWKEDRERQPNAKTFYVGSKPRSSEKPVFRSLIFGSSIFGLAAYFLALSKPSSRSLKIKLLSCERILFSSFHVSTWRFLMYEFGTPLQAFSSQASVFVSLNCFVCFSACLKKACQGVQVNFRPCKRPCSAVNFQPQRTHNNFSTSFCSTVAMASVQPSAKKEDVELDLEQKRLQRKVQRISEQEVYQTTGFLKLPWIFPRTRRNVWGLGGLLRLRTRGQPFFQTFGPVYRCGHARTSIFYTSS